jgi:nitric-oxide synthase
MIGHERPSCPDAARLACGSAGPINLASIPFRCSPRAPFTSPPPPATPSVAHATHPVLLCSPVARLTTPAAALCARPATLATAPALAPRAHIVAPTATASPARRCACSATRPAWRRSQRCQRMVKRQALARKPSGLACCYGCGVPMQTRRRLH